MGWAAWGVSPLLLLPGRPRRFSLGTAGRWARSVWETRGCRRWGAGRKSRGARAAGAVLPWCWVLARGWLLVLGAVAARPCVDAGFASYGEDLQGAGCENALVVCSAPVRWVWRVEQPPGSARFRGTCGKGARGCAGSSGTPRCGWGGLRAPVLGLPWKWALGSAHCMQAAQISSGLSRRCGSLPAAVQPPCAPGKRCGALRDPRR